MELLIKALVLFVALEHIGFCALETVLWRKPIGLKIFRNTPEFAEKTAGMAANQGLYNLFLVAGLLWSLVQPELAFPLQCFFLSCIVIAGAFGALTISWRILILQALPAALTLLLVILTRS